MDEDSNYNDLIQYSDIEFVNGVFCRDLSVQKTIILQKNQTTLQKRKKQYLCKQNLKDYWKTP